MVTVSGEPNYGAISASYGYGIEDIAVVDDQATARRPSGGGNEDGTDSIPDSEDDSKHNYGNGAYISIRFIKVPAAQHDQ